MNECFNQKEIFEAAHLCELWLILHHGLETRLDMNTCVCIISYFIGILFKLLI